MVESVKSVLDLPVKTTLDANDQVLIVANTAQGGNLALITSKNLLSNSVGVGYTGSVGFGASQYLTVNNGIITGVGVSS